MIVLFVVVLVVFGPQKLPELARGLGKLMAEFRKASTDFKSAFEQEMRDIERQARETEWKKSQAAAPATASVAAPAEPPAAGELPAGGESAHTETEGVVAREAASVAPAEAPPDGGANASKNGETKVAVNAESAEPPHGVV